MPLWKEHHFARATEFVQLLADTLGRPARPVAAAPSVPPPRPISPASLPKPAAPTASAVFKSIPWKK
jgi:hypothetical protein